MCHHFEVSKPVKINGNKKRLKYLDTNYGLCTKAPSTRAIFLWQFLFARVDDEK